MGDAVFFNPALFHAAGSNQSKDIRRIANLLQVSSAYGRAMESVDRLKMSVALFPALKRLLAEKAIAAEAADNAIRASAEGYSFPTNLDRDPAVGGMAPQSQQALMRQALAEGWSPDVFTQAAEAQAWRKLTLVFLPLQTSKGRLTMATIRSTLETAASPDAAWAAVRDVGALHTRLAPGFVAHTRLEPGARVVTFANGMVVREPIVTIDDIPSGSCTAEGGRRTHSNAALVVSESRDEPRASPIADILCDSQAAWWHRDGMQGERSSTVDRDQRRLRPASATRRSASCRAPSARRRLFPPRHIRRTARSCASSDPAPGRVGYVDRRGADGEGVRARGANRRDARGGIDRTGDDDRALLAKPAPAGGDEVEGAPPRSPDRRGCRRRRSLFARKPGIAPRPPPPCRRAGSDGRRACPRTADSGSRSLPECARRLQPRPRPSASRRRGRARARSNAIRRRARWRRLPSRAKRRLREWRPRGAAA